MLRILSIWVLINKDTFKGSLINSWKVQVKLYIHVKVHLYDHVRNEWEQSYEGVLTLMNTVIKKLVKKDVVKGWGGVWKC